ncbi:hypothetical protein [Jidongwangia harbinensis]|uniref:hypothetical protein n=1 Tax=Jidongwangia harbinensis TaxID=2878561 RepID=UPI001CD933AE|nr:hypothetical protein [Jidongwangia harbinensis]MCA2218659.1 hypothetical protein [Jidongwangia harbinensis]
MSTAPEEVAAPADDAVLFRSSPVRTFAAVFGTVVVAYLLVSPLVNRLVGDADDLASTAVQAVVVGTLVAGGFALSARSSLPTWVRVSAAGLELAAQGSDPVLLAWPDIRTVVVQRSLTRTVLEVTPVDLDRVHPVDGEGPGWPAMTETGSGTAFTADLTQIWPGPRALRRELARRLHAHPDAARGR